MTKDECSSNYKFSITRVACLIRLINLMAMWIFASLLIILNVADCFDCFPPKEPHKTILEEFFPPERDDETINKG